MAMFNWLEALYAIVLALGGWILRVIWEAVKDLQRDVRSLEKMLPDTYARKDDLTDKFELIMQMLKEIRDGMSKKVDR